MHEMSLCEGIIQIVEEQAKAQNFTKVSRVCLEIGALAGIEIDALTFCFEVVCRNTIAEHSTLDITQIPAQAWCLQCAKSIEVQERYSACNHCGSYQLQVTDGDQMTIKQLEVN